MRQSLDNFEPSNYYFNISPSKIKMIEREFEVLVLFDSFCGYSRILFKSFIK